MADLKQRLETAASALDAFDEMLATHTVDETRRDAAILRFILAFGATLTAVRQILKEVELEERASTGACIRASRAAGIVDESAAEGLLALAKDRNLAVHVYNEAMARELFHRLPGHAALLRRWLDGTRRRASV